MQSEENLAMRSLKWCVPVAAIVTYMLSALHHRDWAVGYLIGALLSLFSLFSLTVLVPVLIRPGAPQFVKGLLALALFLKLPIYMFALYILSRADASGAGASVLGISLAPLVITVNTVLGMVPRRATRTRRQQTAATQEPAMAPVHRATQRALPAEGG